MFLLFACITLFGALAMLLQKNAIKASLCLVASFFGIAGLFVLLANPVAAALQIIVYSGAITVLILFVIMLLNQHEEEHETSSKPIQTWLSVALVLSLAVGAGWLILASPGIKHLAIGPRPRTAIELDALGSALFPGHLFAFEVVSLLLLAAMIAAVSLTKRDF